MARRVIKYGLWAGDELHAALVLGSIGSARE